MQTSQIANFLPNLTQIRKVPSKQTDATLPPPRGVAYPGEPFPGDRNHQGLARQHDGTVHSVPGKHTRLSRRFRSSANG